MTDTPRLRELRKGSQRLLVSVLLALLATTTAFAQKNAQETALDRYIAKPDPSYSWKLEKTTPGQGFTQYVLKLTSQSWRTADEVDRPVWTHWLTIVKPATVKHNKALLFIGGGSNKDPVPANISERARRFAVESETVVAELADPPMPRTMSAREYAGRGVGYRPEEPDRLPAQVLGVRLLPQDTQARLRDLSERSPATLRARAAGLPDRRLERQVDLDLLSWRTHRRCHARRPAAAGRGCSGCRTGRPTSTVCSASSNSQAQESVSDHQWWPRLWSGGLHPHRLVPPVNGPAAGSQ